MYNKPLHRFAVFTAFCTFVLIIAGGMVTSERAGLSVPDWPNTYGHFMFAFPLKDMVGGIFYEHGHRMIASTVGLLTAILAIWLWRAERRRWVKNLGWAALGTVVAQGVLGGITVLFFLPTAVSTGHALLAQTFFCLVIAIAYFTSKEAASGAGRRIASGAGRLRRAAAWAAGAIFVQLLLGAWMRHSDAGLAIPDFPLAYGRALPPLSAAGVTAANALRLRLNLPPATMEQIWIHFAHRIGAVCVAAVLLRMIVVIVARFRSERRLFVPAVALAALLCAQITLGAFTVLSLKNPYVATAHVAGGALLLGVTILTLLRSHRLIGAPARAGSAPAAARFSMHPAGAR